MARLLRRLWHGLLDAVFIPCCEVCDRPLVDGEQLMCLHCLTELPRTHNHRTEFSDMTARLMSTTRIEKTAAWFHYVRGSKYTTLIHRAKYSHRPMLGRQLGSMYAREIFDDGFFKDIDILMPIPVTERKEMVRGYNQASEIARGISSVTGLPVGDHLVTVKGHKTQTRRSAYDRYINVKGVFGVHHGEEIDGMHILVVDDVLTTGSTMVSACESLHNACPTARLSVLTLGLTSHA